MSSIFTGLYPEEYGFSENRLPAPEQPTLAQRLSQAGYHTFLCSSDPCVGPETLLDRGFEQTFYLPPWSTVSWRRPGLTLRHWQSVLRAAVWRSRAYKVPVEMLVSRALRILNSARKLQPFFLYIHLDVHRPFISDRRRLRPFLDPDVTESDIRAVEYRLRQASFYQSAEDMAPPRCERLHAIVRAMYDAAWFKTDEQIQCLLQALKQQRLFDSTAVVVSSDHGEFLGERFLFRHGVFPYQEAMHVPLLIKWTKGDMAVGDDQRLTSTIDLMPTVCDLAECSSSPDETSGISLLDSSRRHEYVVNQRWAYRRTDVETLSRLYPHYDFSRYDLGHVIALCDERYKFVWTSNGPQFLFDRVSDPAEGTNLIQDAVGGSGEARAAEDRLRWLTDWRSSLRIRPGWDEGRLRPVRRGPYSAPARGDGEARA